MNNSFGVNVLNGLSYLQQLTNIVILFNGTGNLPAFVSHGYGQAHDAFSNRVMLHSS